jgi:hypothetical protein
MDDATNHLNDMYDVVWGTPIYPEFKVSLGLPEICELLEIQTKSSKEIFKNVDEFLSNMDDTSVNYKFPDEVDNV